MTQPILQRMLATIAERRLLPPTGGVVIVGYSGGADSTALLHLLTRAQIELKIELHAAHLHHGMRPEADADVQVCQAVCHSLGVPLHVERVDVPAFARQQKLSLEEAGRNARYAFFERLACQLNAVAVALAHTRDDQIETILINLLRGTGPRGLCGMPYKRDRIIRPLLDATREQTHQYCAEQNLPTVFDSTNLDPNQLRRRVRAELIPLLCDLSPAYDKHLLRLAEILAQEEEWWAEQVGQALSALAPSSLPVDGEPEQLSRARFAEVHPALQRRVLREWLRPRLGTLRLPPFEILEAIRRAALNTERASWQLSPTLRLTTDADTLTLHYDKPESANYEYPVPLNTPVFIPEAGAWLEIRSTGVPARAFEIPRSARNDSRSPGGALALPSGHARAFEIPRSARNDRGGEQPNEIPRSARKDTVFRAGNSCHSERSEESQPTQDAYEAYLDADAIQGQLTVRNARRGERFQPLGMPAPKKLSDIFTDRKVPKTERWRMPLLCDEAGVLWIPGYTIAERAKITPHTQHVLQIHLYRNANDE